MKDYSFKELLLAALLASALTAVVVGGFSIFSARGGSAFGGDFFQKVPFLNKFFENNQATTTSQGLNLTPSVEIYKPLDYEDKVIS
ncbi:MAG: hypothetical protein ABIJ19_01275, partial [Patescibacteria group bacterium]